MVVQLKRKRRTKRSTMQKEPGLRFVYLTLPDNEDPILNLNDGTKHTRYRVTRDQLFDLNKQIADTLVNHKISAKNAFDEQLVLNLEKAANL